LPKIEKNEIDCFLTGNEAPGWKHKHSFSLNSCLINPIHTNRREENLTTTVCEPKNEEMASPKKFALGATLTQDPQARELKVQRQMKSEDRKRKFKKNLLNLQSRMNNLDNVRDSPTGFNHLYSLDTTNASTAESVKIPEFTLENKRKRDFLRESFNSDNSHGKNSHRICSSELQTSDIESPRAGQRPARKKSKLIFYHPTANPEYRDFDKSGHSFSYKKKSSSSLEKKHDICKDSGISADFKNSFKKMFIQSCPKRKYCRPQQPLAAGATQDFTGVPRTKQDQEQKLFNISEIFTCPRKTAYFGSSE